MTSGKHRLVGHLLVPLAPAEAFGLFTPSGERDWAHGWEPHFPTPVRDDTEPGTVFETDVHGQRTVWIVTGRERPHCISYSRFTPGTRAGTVSVALEPSGEHTEVEVTYELTSLTPSAAPELQRFADRYVAYVKTWEHAISAYLLHRG